jgi:hypothetical protein
MSPPNPQFFRKDASTALTLVTQSPEEWLQIQVVEWAVAGKVNGTGRVATGALYDVACGKRWPLNLLAKLIANALDNGCTLAWAKHVTRIMDGYIERKARQMGIRDESAA